MNRFHKYQISHSQIGYILVYLIVGLFFISCSNDIAKVRFFDRKTLPDQSVTNAHITRTEYGELQMKLEAPTINQYTTPEHKTIYPNGVAITFFENGVNPKAYIRANYGISYDDRDIMEARDSVVVIDYRTGDTSYLKSLVWNSNEHRIYSNHPLRSVNGARVTYGDGLESDDNFERPLILRQRGTIEWKEEE